MVTRSYIIITIIRLMVTRSYIIITKVRLVVVSSHIIITKARLVVVSSHIVIITVVCVTSATLYPSLYKSLHEYIFSTLAGFRAPPPSTFPLPRPLSARLPPPFLLLLLLHSLSSPPSPFCLSGYL